MALVVVVIALPIKIYAFVTMNKQGWLTRNDAQRVQGQGEMESCSMLVKPELSARRLAIGLVLVTVLPALLVFVAMSYQRPELPPGPPVQPVAADQRSRPDAMQARELQRSRRVTGVAPTLTAPVLLRRASPRRCRRSCWLPAMPLTTWAKPRTPCPRPSRWSTGRC